MLACGLMCGKKCHVGVCEWRGLCGVARWCCPIYSAIPSFSPVVPSMTRAPVFLIYYIFTLYLAFRRVACWVHLCDCSHCLFCCGEGGRLPVQRGVSGGDDLCLQGMLFLLNPVVSCFRRECVLLGCAEEKRRKYCGL